MKFVPGCGCCVGPCDWTITVIGCSNLVYSGVTVNVTDSGGATYSGTTNGSGVVTFTGLAAGTASATVVAPNARWTNHTQSAILGVGSNSSTLTANVASGYTCYYACLDPIKTTLNYSVNRPYDHVGTCTTDILTGTLTFDGSATWSGAYLPAFATPPTTDGRIRLVNTSKLVYLEELFGAVVTWSASATPSNVCSPLAITATVSDPRYCPSTTITITITE